MRRALYTAEVLRDDQPISRFFDINWQVDKTDFGVEVHTHRTAERGSYNYTQTMTNLETDIDRLAYRKMDVDREKTHALVLEANATFGDLLPARIRGQHWWTLGLTWDAIKLIGLEALMLAPYDQPENLHRLMAWLRDEAIAFISWFENEGLLTDQNENDYVGSGGVAFTDELPAPGRAEGSPARLIDLWGFAESQETVGVSPQMFAEFVLPYQRPILERFGLNCYGCCEPVDTRIDAILTIPRLRRISVSPWANERVLAERLGDGYIYSRKPNPAPVCVDFNEEAIRSSIRHTLDITRNCRLELIMKDTHTVEHDPRRLARWVEIAREEVNRAGMD
jgi:hypothetical protein